MDECKPLLAGICALFFILMAVGADSVVPIIQPREPPAAAEGRAVELDPIKPTLIAPGTNLLTLKYIEPLSTFAFKFNVRHYMKACLPCPRWRPPTATCSSTLGRCRSHDGRALRVGDYQNPC